VTGNLDWLYRALVILGILGRLAILVIPGNSITTPWSGGGDMGAYVLMGHNLASGDGYTYAHVSSAWRTPGYPLVIAGAIRVFGAYFPVTVRCLQVVLAILAAYLCMWGSEILFGARAAKIALLLALLFPTLIYFSGEFLSESISAFFVALFLWLLAKDSISPHWITATGMGLAIGLGVLFRPNLAAIGALGLAAAWLCRRPGRTRIQVTFIPLCAAVVVGPWIARNYHVFGRFILTTKSGTDALCGILNPESRFLPGWEDHMRALVGHRLPNELETNSPERLALGSEFELDRKCWHATRQVWDEMSWGDRVRWALVKWTTYWLGTDQLLNPGHISKKNLVLHGVAVVFYWGLLALACVGWWILRKSRLDLAVLLIGYAVLMTVLHTPFVMNSRIRAPAMDPLIAVLAGGGAVALWTISDSRERIIKNIEKVEAASHIVARRQTPLILTCIISLAK